MSSECNEDRKVWVSGENAVLKACLRFCVWNTGISKLEGVKIQLLSLVCLNDATGLLFFVHDIRFPGFHFHKYENIPYVEFSKKTGINVHGYIDIEREREFVNVCLRYIGQETTQEV